jgi:uncharacterized protein (DUF983 family)
VVGATPLGLLQTALLCRCPRCGQASIFTGLLTVRDRCPACDLNLAAADTGDGAAAFLILIEGAVLVLLAFFVEFHFNPPLWVHVILWPALALPLTILLMRPCKAFLVAQQFRNRPGEMGAD